MIIIKIIIIIKVTYNVLKHITKWTIDMLYPSSQGNFLK